MNIQNILDQFIGSNDGPKKAVSNSGGMGASLGRVANAIPGGLAGGAAAGGIMALLVSNKSARKFAGKAATYGGAAVLGGIAYSAFKNWKANNAGASVDYQGLSDARADVAPGAQVMTGEFQLALIKAMIAAANSDGHIDSDEQQRIFGAVEQMQLDTRAKALIFDLLSRPIPISEIVHGVETLEQKSELYLASCLAINPDHESEKRHLDELARALDLPAGLPAQLSWQARQSLDTQAA